MPARKAKGKANVKATSTAKATVARRKTSPQKTVGPQKTPTRCRGKRIMSVSATPSPAETSSPNHPTMSGKYIPGHSPQDFGNRRRGSNKSTEDSDNGSEYADAETGDGTPEPDFKVEEEDCDEEYSTAWPGAPTPKAKRKRAPAKPAKMVYKKSLRRDSAKFTTTQAMIDAEEEFDPRVAAHRGKAIKGTGNGRLKGRRLVRWNAYTDQLLLLCLHHELARNREELPYELIAQRMFPEKNATGGAIKERFAKLRIECLNRGSWVPPIVGKTPQNSRPDVRGVIRLAPGVDKGRYILWKEDASKLVDPKDINKGYVKAQGRGEEYPPRVWISAEAEEEFLKTRHYHDALNLSPLQGSVPKDDDEMFSEDDDNESNVDSDEDTIVLASAKRKKRTARATPRKKVELVNPTKQIKSVKSRAVKTETSGDETDAADFHPSKKELGHNRFGVAGRTRQTKIPVTSFKRPLDVEDAYAGVPQSAEQSDSEIDDKETNSALVMMAFDEDEEVRPLRSIVVIRGLASEVLQKYPVGIYGPGKDDYAEDEVIEGHVVDHDDNESPVVEQDENEDTFIASDDESGDEESTAHLFKENPGIVWGYKTNSGHIVNPGKNLPSQQNFSNNLTNGLAGQAASNNQADAHKFGDMEQLLVAMQANMPNGVAKDYPLWREHMKAIEKHQNQINQQDSKSIDDDFGPAIEMKMKLSGHNSGIDTTQKTSMDQTTNQQGFMDEQGMYSQYDMNGQVDLFSTWEPPVGPHNDFGLDFTSNKTTRTNVKQESQHVEFANPDVALGDLDDDDNKPQGSYSENVYSSIMASRGYYDYGSSI